VAGNLTLSLDAASETLASAFLSAFLLGPPVDCVFETLLKSTGDGSE
jgi:hypothetical protein